VCSFNSIAILSQQTSFKGCCIHSCSVEASLDRPQVGLHQTTRRQT
jgi:hypothetical protein